MAQGKRQETEPGVKRHGDTVTYEQVTRGAPGNYAALGYRGNIFGSAVQPKRGAVAYREAICGHKKQGRSETGRQGRNETAIGGTGNQLKSGISLKQQIGVGRQETEPGVQ
jgi:hypothetical protein